jgi:hypothetical protein
MKLSRFQEYLFEAEEPKVKDESIYTDIKNDIQEMIEKSLNTSDEKTSADFISAFLRDSDKTKIEGLINDSDIYEFYLKYRNDIDQLLSEINFYEEKPTSLDCFSLYDYIIVGTNKAIRKVIEMMEKKD